MRPSIAFLWPLLFFGRTAISQKIIGSAMADDHGITNNQRNAKYLVVEKQLSDSQFQRLDYQFAGPMIRRATFREKDLKTLNGDYADYHSNGSLATSGQYSDNKKNGDWYTYDDTLKALRRYKYHLDTLLAVTDLDSLDKAKSKHEEDTTGEIEAHYNGGVLKIRSVISKNFKVPGRTASLKKGGTVKVRFVVDTNGRPVDIQIAKSVEFAFDEESLRTVGLLKDWSPAWQRGKKVNAYRIQPITISL